jgi:hypothetical protein
MGMPRPANRTAERAFFGGMAVLLCVVVFIGFFRTFFGAGFVEAPLPSPILRVHGIVFTAWMMLFLAQAALVSARRVAWHRSLGIVAFCLPPLMIALGVMAALDALGRKVTIGALDPATSLAIPLWNIAAFAIVIVAAWNARRRPDAHKRLVLLATIGLSDAALGRLPWAQMGIPTAAGAVIGLAALILAVLHLLIRQRTGGFAAACLKCGRPFCRRCKLSHESQSYCTQCINIFLKKDMVGIEAQIAKRQQLARRQLFLRVERRVSDVLLPGLGVGFGGRPVLGGALLLLALACTTLALVWLPAFVAPALMGASVWPLEALLGAIWLAAAVIAQLLPVEWR